MAVDLNRPISTVMAEFAARVDAASALGALGTLRLTTALQSGTPVSGYILDAKAGSTIVSNIPGITVDSAQRKYSGTPTGGAATLADGLVETSSGATKSTAISVAAAAESTFLITNGATNTVSKAKLAAVKAGTARMVVAHVGDSTTHGYQNNNTANRTGTAANSYVGQLPALSNAALSAPAVANALLGASDEAVAYMTTYEPRHSNPGSLWSVLSTGQAANSVGGWPWQAIDVSASWNFTPTGNVDRIDVYWLTDNATGGTAGNVLASVDGGATLATLPGGQAQALRKQTISVTSGAHTVNLKPAVAGTASFIAGVDCYNSAVKSISHLNLGWGARKAADMASETYGYSYLKGLKTVAPDLTIINIGINDWTGGTSPASFKTSMQAIITGAKLSGDVWLMTPFPSDISAASQSAQDAIVAAIKDLGVTNNLYVLDCYSRFGSYTQAVANGLANDLYKLHPNTAGYAVMADSVTKALATLF